jgi:hypothetical protein
MAGGASRPDVALASSCEHLGAPGATIVASHRRIMIKELSDLPLGVIGFEVAGKLRAEDYRDVLRPSIERAAAQGPIRCVVVIERFDGLMLGALWEDIKLGVKYLRAWKRIALVTDIKWITRMASWFAWMTPGEVEHFPLAQRSEAIASAAA